MTTPAVPLESPPVIQRAAAMYRRLRDHRLEPVGAYDRERRRWYPSALWKRPCCDHVDPQFMRAHCRSMNHVAALHNLPPIALRQIRAEVRQQDLVQRVKDRLGVPDPDADARRVRVNLKPETIKRPLYSNWSPQ